MIKWKNVTAMALALAVTGAPAFAQKEKKTGSEKSQEIVIRKSGDSKEKMTIVVDGDKITLNGKPIDEIKDGDVTILRGDDVHGFAPRARVYRSPNVQGQRALEELNMLRPTRANKALLGVVTEKAEGGAKITEVTKESGAEKAGLKKDDIIMKVGDKKIESSNDLIAAIGDHKPNDKVDVTYKRNGKEAKTTATLGESKLRSFSYNMNDNFDGEFDMPIVPMAPFAEGFGFSRKPKIGLQIQDVEEGTGVEIRDVDDESAAEKAGLKEGDVINEVNGKAIAGVDAMKEQIKDLKEGDVLKMTYRRGGKTQTADVKIPKKLKTANL